MDSVVRRSPMPFSAGLNGGGGGGGREELWSEAETAALVEAWGERYVRLNRGSLRQGDWKEVAIAVNAARAAAGRPPKSDVQCKNRVDTLKKKYKIEKSKLGRSLWPFFDDLDFLIGGAALPDSKKPSSMTAAPVTFGYHQSRSGQFPPPAFVSKRRSPNAGAAVHSGSWSRPPVNSSGSSESSRGEFDDGWGDHNDGEDEDEDGVRHSRNQGLRKNVFSDGVVGVKRSRNWDNFGADYGVGGGSGVGKDRPFAVLADGSGGGKDVAFSELAGAIMKLADIYEKVEVSKQQQMLQLERQRMEFTKDLEFQRMKMFTDAQLEVEKMKRPRNHSSTGKKL